MIDPLAIATLGRITTQKDAVVNDGLGYYVTFTEEIITEPSKRKGGGFERRKKITINVCVPQDDGEVECNEMTYIHSDIDLNVKKVDIVDNEVRIKLFNPQLRNVTKDVKLKIKDRK